MNPRLLSHFRRELQHLREMGGEFAAEYPKIAGRLGLESLECADPYVERLLEGFAFMAARVQLKIETSYSRTARNLLEMVYPDYLSPVPSMLIAEVQPSMYEGSLAAGFTIERGTSMRSHSGPEAATACQFRTAADLTLWPVRIDGARVLSSKAAIDAAGASAPDNVRSALALKLSTEQDLGFSELAIDDLRFFITGADATGALLYEQVMAHTVSVAIVSEQAEIRSPSRAVRLSRVGFEQNEALLPGGPRGFDGYRVLQEYFVFPQRFQFFEINNLQHRLARTDATEIEIVFLFDNNVEHNADLFSAQNFMLNCVPAINLFSKTADRIHLDSKKHEFHLIPDRTRPMDYEVYRVQSMTGYGSDDTEQPFYPYFSINSQRMDREGSFFNLNREPRLMSARQKRDGARSSYIGSEVFLSLVDIDDNPYLGELRQLSVETLCTNRDLPLHMPIGRGETDLFLETGAPVSAIRCISGPTQPRPSRAHQRDAWQLVSNLSLNYLSISDTGHEDDGQHAAAMLRQMLELYSEGMDKPGGRQIEGVVQVTTRPVVRQRRVRSHVEVAHGLQVRLRVDEAAFEGTGAYLFGCVMEHFFAAYASTNSFAETVLETIQRDEIGRWPVRNGLRRQL